MIWKTIINYTIISIILKINDIIKTSLKTVGKTNIHSLNCVVARLKGGYIYTVSNICYFKLPPAIFSLKTYFAKPDMKNSPF